jgi:hypothetical protein
MHSTASLAKKPNHFLGLGFLHLLFLSFFFVKFSLNFLKGFNRKTAAIILIGDGETHSEFLIGVLTHIIF